MIEPGAWSAILDGRPWVCTEAEDAQLEKVLRAFRVAARPIQEVLP